MLKKMMMIAAVMVAAGVAAPAQSKVQLSKIKLPPGFKINLYAVVPDARSIAVAPSTNMMFVGTRKTSVWAVTNRNSGQVMDVQQPNTADLAAMPPNVRVVTGAHADHSARPLSTRMPLGPRWVIRASLARTSRS